MLFGYVFLLLFFFLFFFVCFFLLQFLFVFGGGFACFFCCCLLCVFGVCVFFYLFFVLFCFVCFFFGGGGGGESGRCRIFLSSLLAALIVDWQTLHILANQNRSYYLPPLNINTAFWPHVQSIFGSKFGMKVEVFA